ncbi:hypothetical protein A616_17170 [Brevibacillus brevis X23]|nr:hypothetical protein A616_17170 [Brevibacillus brevis X23]
MNLYHRIGSFYHSETVDELLKRFTEEGIAAMTTTEPDDIDGESEMIVVLATKPKKAKEIYLKLLQELEEEEQ